jgi:nucleoside-diphosphate-sugar epimerase
MRIAITGATGNIGTAVTEELRRRSEVGSLVGIARRRPEEGRWPADVELVAADVATDDLVPALAGADVVIHLAWLFQPTHRPLVTWQANAVGSARVFDAAMAADVGAVVHASSVGAYSPGTGDGPVDESWPTHSLPTAAYGREKAYVERVLDAVEARHPDRRVVRLRPAFVFRRPAATEQRRLFLGPLVPRWLLRPGRLPVVPVPAGLRFQAVHGTDLARAVAAVAVGGARGAFNVASDPVIDVDRLGDVMGARVVEVPRALVRSAVAAAWTVRAVPADPNLVDLALHLPVMATDRARRELGWAPAVPATEAVREALAGIAAGAGGATPPLAPDSAAGRAGELARGVGERDR